MGGVGDELAVLREEPFEALRHGVHGGSQGGDLRGRAGVRVGGGEVAGGESSGRGVEVAERPGHGAGDGPSDAGHGDEDDDGHTDQAQPVATDQGVHLLRVEGQPNGAVHVPSRGHRHGHVQQVGVQRVGVSRPLGAGAAERGLDLGASREVATGGPDVSTRDVPALSTTTTRTPVRLA